MGVWKFALFGATAMLIPYILFGWLLGPEFPALLGGPIGLIAAVFAARQGWFLPDEPWDFGPRENWEDEWMGNVNPDDLISEVEGQQRIGIVNAWAPYALVAFFLVITRLPALGLVDFLSGLTIEWANIFGVPDISADFAPFYLPGFMFLLAIVITYFLHRMNFQQIADSWRVAGKADHRCRLRPAAGAADGSGVHQLKPGTTTPPGSKVCRLELANGAASLAGGTWPFFSPWIGALGAFVAGSNTVSNLTFSLFPVHDGGQHRHRRFGGGRGRGAGGWRRGGEHDHGPQRGRGLGDLRAFGQGRRPYPQDHHPDDLLRAAGRLRGLHLGLRLRP